MTCRNFCGYAGITIKAASDEDFREPAGQFVNFYAGALFNAHWGEHISVFPDNRLGISMASAGLSIGRSSRHLAAIPVMGWLQQGSRDSPTPAAMRTATRPSSYWSVEAMYQSGSRVIKMDDREGASPVHALVERR